MKTVVSTLAALSLLTAAPALAEGPQAPPGWGTPAPKPKAEPKPGELVSGEARFTLGGKPWRLTVVNGDIVQREGVFVVTATWRDSQATPNNFLSKQGQQFQIVFGAQAPGPLVNGVQVTMAYARDEEGVSRIVKASTCTFRATKIGAKAFAGKGSCTAGLLDAQGKEARPITDIEFSGTAR